MPTRVDEKAYFTIRTHFTQNPDQMIELEQHYIASLATAIQSVADNIADDFAKAEEFLPFWINYPSLQRGRAPTGQSIPWLEVGETVIGVHVI